MDYFVIICKGGSEASTVEELMDLWVVNDCRCFWVEEERKPRHRKSKGVVKVVRPRWPGYLFVQLKTVDRWPELRVCRTVVGILAVDGFPARMREWQFDRLVAEVEGTDVGVGEKRVLSDGDSVRIAAGQFTGIEGIFRNKNVELILFGKKVQYSIDEEFLVKLN